MLTDEPNKNLEFINSIKLINFDFMLTFCFKILKCLCGNPFFLISSTMFKFTIKSLSCQITCQSGAVKHRHTIPKTMSVI